METFPLVIIVAIGVLFYKQRKKDNNDNNE